MFHDTCPSLRRCCLDDVETETELTQPCVDQREQCDTTNTGEISKQK